MSTETEERAIKSVPELIKANGNYVECWRNGYICGATEQEKITKQEMIEKAWEFVCEHFVVGMEYDDFRKAMEG